MTLTELRKALEEIRDRGDRDPEVNHADADAVLLEYASSRGAMREGLVIEKVWDEIKKWYA